MAAPHRPRGPRAAEHQRDARALYDAVFGFAWKALERLGLSEADREEVAQRVVIKAYAGWSKYRADRGTPAQWLWGIVRNEVRLFRRERRRDPELAGEDLALDVPAETISPEESVTLKDLVASAWERVPRAARNVVRLHVLGEFTFEEIAEMEGISKSQAERLHKVGLQKLREATERSREPKHRGVAVVPLSMAALFDLEHAPSPPPEVVERGWQRAIADLGLDDAPDSEPPPSGPRRCASASQDATAPPSRRPRKPRVTRLRLVHVLGPLAGGVLGALLAPLFPGCDHGRERSVEAASLAPAPVAIAASPIIVASASGPVASPPAAVAVAPLAVKESPEPPPSSSPISVGRNSAPHDGRSEHERALALVQRGREALEAGDPTAAIVALGQHAESFANGPYAAERETLRTAACARLRRSPTSSDAGVLAPCAGRP
ncbi:MAG: sigma-70 family RNA polymerase sigma factor [Minicystis sp.]